MVYDNGGEEGFVGQVRWPKKINIFKLDASMSSTNSFMFLNNNSYKMVHLDVRENVICGYNCR